MAMDILWDEITHEARHDLESFYWLLVFILLRHTNHGHRLGKAAFGSLFTVVDWYIFGTTKWGWITNPTVPLTIPGNAPLNELLEEFRVVLRGNLSQTPPAERHVTHSRILALFDKALAAENWPKNDAALGWVPPNNNKETEEIKATLGMLKKKGTRDDTATNSILPRLQEAAEGDQSTFMNGLEDELNDTADGGRGAPSNEQIDRPMDFETAFWQDRSVPADLPAQPIAGPSRAYTPPATQHSFGTAEVLPPSPAIDHLSPPVKVETEVRQAGLSIVDPPVRPIAGPSRAYMPPASEHSFSTTEAPPPSSVIDHLSPPVEVEASKMVADERPKGRARARSTRRADSPERPRRTGRVTRQMAASRKAAETWPASQAVGERAEPARRYNLRSTSRRDPTVAATLDAAIPALPENQRMTRSRSRATPQVRMAGVGGSSVGKRSRTGNGLEENLEVQMPKRQRTLSQPRVVRKPSKNLRGK